MEEGGLKSRSVRSCFKWQYSPGSLWHILWVRKIFSRAISNICGVFFSLFFSPPPLSSRTTETLTLFAARLLVASHVFRADWILWSKAPVWFTLRWSLCLWRRSGLTGSLGIHGRKAFEAVQSTGRNMSQKLHVRSLPVNVLFEHELRVFFFSETQLDVGAKNFAVVSFFFITHCCRLFKTKGPGQSVLSTWREGLGNTFYCSSCLDHFFSNAKTRVWSFTPGLKAAVINAHRLWRLNWYTTCSRLFPH